MQKLGLAGWIDSRLLLQISLLLGLLHCLGCSSDTSKGPSAPLSKPNASRVETPVSSDASPPTKGQSLYATHCASCHNALEKTTRRNASARDITRAIDNVGQMSKLSVLSRVELILIAQALD